jgi:hypothetical protein
MDFFVRLSFFGRGGSELLMVGYLKTGSWAESQSKNLYVQPLSSCNTSLTLGVVVQARIASGQKKHKL